MLEMLEWVHVHAPALYEARGWIGACLLTFLVMLPTVRQEPPRV